MHTPTPALIAWLAAAALLLAACAPPVATPTETPPVGDLRPPAGDLRPTAAPTSTSASAPIPTSTSAPGVAATPTLGPEDKPPSGAQLEFKTDFSQHSVPYNEILSGGPPKGGIGVDGGIPSILNPRFVSVAEADEWLKPVEPVIQFQIADDVRAYPLQILMWHEIVNDTVGDVPVLVTFCPLCNTAIAFERSVDGRELLFGTTGRLRYSNLIMYDRQTETWWQQATGEAIAGELTGRGLVFRPASIIAWAAFRDAYPDGKVLSRDTGFGRSYGRNPYAGYDDVNRTPFLYRGPETPGVLPAVAHVLTLDLGGEAVAYPYDVLQTVRVVNDTVGGQEVVVLWSPGTASALNGSTVAGGREVGSASAYARQLDGRRLTFSFDGERIVDDETGSEWDGLGRATAGPLAGAALTPLVAIDHFWFSWAAFKPDTRIYQP